jgi:hypothetical protein
MRANPLQTRLNRASLAEAHYIREISSCGTALP